LVDDARMAGTHTVQWNAVGMSSGVYFCRLQIRSVEGGGSVSETRKLVLLR
jgi:hypothetical protein